MSLSPQPFHAKEKDLCGHSGTITCLAFSPLGDHLASGGEDGNVIVWDPMTGTLLHRVPVNSAITSMAWDPNDTRHCIFIGNANGTIFTVNNFIVCFASFLTFVTFLIVNQVPEHDLDSAILTGVDAPVYAIAIDIYSSVIALGVGSEVHLAKQVTPSKYHLK